VLARQLGSLDGRFTGVRTGTEEITRNTPARDREWEYTTLSTTWKAADIGFFYPDMQDEIRHKSDSVYWKNVYAFVEQIRDHATIVQPAIVRLHLKECLRGEAQSWYMNDLTDLQREGLKYSPNGVEAWCRVLTDRFKEPHTVALAKLQQERYSVHDARAGRSTRAYVGQIIRHSQAVDMDRPLQQMANAWNNLDPELQPFVRRPTANTSMAEFMEDLASHEQAWYNMYNSRRASESRRLINSGFRSSNLRGRSTAFRGGLRPFPFNPSFNFRPFVPFQSFQSSMSANQNHSEANQSGKPAQNALPASKPVLQLTAGPSSQGGSRSVSGNSGNSDNTNSNRYGSGSRSDSYGGFKGNSYNRGGFSRGNWNSSGGGQYNRNRWAGKYNRFRQTDGANLVSEDDYWDVLHDSEGFHDSQARLGDMGYVACEEGSWSETDDSNWSEASNSTSQQSEESPGFEPEDDAMLVTEIGSQVE
jgi:hypothetical protein